MEGGSEGSDVCTEDVQVFFTVRGKAERALFSRDTPQELIVELFRSAAEAGHRDVIKLYNQSGCLVVISPHLAANGEQNPYRLEVVGRTLMQAMPDELADQLQTLQDRVTSLESYLNTHASNQTPASNGSVTRTAGAPDINMISSQVQGLVNKVQLEQNNSTWMGCSRRCGGMYRDSCASMQRRRISLPKHSAVKAKFSEICDVTLTQEVRDSLRLPEFDSYAWTDEEVLLMLYTMFSDLGLLEAFHIEPVTMRAFLYEVYKHYNEVPFHNFRHCFCVAQMMYTMAWRVNLVARLGPLEMLVLLVACICHDLDHPGYNNIYQINARTELAIRYNDISPLENHHCSVAFRILEIGECNIFKSFSPDTFRQVREGIIRCILATDMARHNEILAEFKDITPIFDYSSKSHTNLLSMVLIKVADISNEARPIDVAEPWLDRLLEEFFAQSALEKQEGLPVTPFMDPDKVSKPSSQVRFIGLVLLPLFEALGEHMPELQDLIVQPVRDALEYYRRLNEATREGRSRKSVVEVIELMPASARPLMQDALPLSRSSQSVRSRRSIPSHRSLSRSNDGSVETNLENLEESSESLDNLAEGNESGDSETATEVEVSEKTLKFKIATESNSDRKSYPNSRKGSRDRTSINCVELARAVQRSNDRERRSSPGFSSSGSLGNYCSCNYDRTKSRSSDGSIRSSDTKSPCNSEYCHKLLGKQIEEEKEFVDVNDKANATPTKDTDEHMLSGSEDQDETGKTNFDEIIIEKSETCNNLKSPESKNDGKSIFARIKQFTDRLSLGFDKPTKVNKNNNSRTNSMEQISSKMQSKSKENIIGNCCNKNTNTNTNMDEMFENDNKASTLPKVKKSDYKRTWKLLMSNKERQINSLEHLPGSAGNILKKDFNGSEVKVKAVNDLTAQSLVGKRDRMEI